MSELLPGADEFRQKLERMASEAPREVMAALYQEALIETNESKRRTPVDTGALRSSHETHKPVMNGRDISVEISVGGPAAPYAIRVHEDLEADHPNGGQARFLASTIEESAPFMAQRLSKRIDLNRLAGK